MRLPTVRTIVLLLSWFSGAGVGIAAVPIVASPGFLVVGLGDSVSFNIQAYNDPTSYNATGLPDGLMVDTTTGKISGSPRVTGSFLVALSATNADGTDTENLTLRVDRRDSPPVVTGPTTFESSYYRYDYPAWPHFGIAAMNFPESFDLLDGPKNIYIDRTRGTVDYNDAEPGRYHATLVAKNSFGTGTAKLEWIVYPVVSFPWAERRDYEVGDAIKIMVHFNSVVVVSGAPKVPLSAHWPDRLPRAAVYSAGSGTDTLTFTFQSKAGDAAPDEIHLAPIELNGGSIQHPSGVDAILAFPRVWMGDPERVVTISGWPTITSATTASGTVAQPFSFTITAENWARFGATGLPPGLELDEATGVISGTPTLSGTFTVALRSFNWNRSINGTLTLTIADSPTGRPTITQQPASRAASAGSPVTFSSATTAANASYQWHYNGGVISGATNATFTVNAAGPATAGIYTVVVSDHGQASVSVPAVLGIESGAKTIGAGNEVGADIRHANGNIYDQILLSGGAATITADRDQIVRASFVDLSDNIVQVEFSGAGTLSIVLDVPSGPAPAKNYHQPAVEYMRGHAGIVITGADETTHVSVFSVGRITAVDQSLFRDDVDYDGVANIAFIAIMSANGKFGGVRAANANFWSTRGQTGIYAPGVTFMGPVYVCEITATEEATPVFVLGGGSDTAVKGGDLAQTNNRAVQVAGLTRLRFEDGMMSTGVRLSARRCVGRLETNGRDVTADVVVNPP